MLESVSLILAMNTNDSKQIYTECAKILGEWPMVEACLEKKYVLTLFQAMAIAKANIETAEEILMCITRRTHPHHAERFAAQEAAHDNLRLYRQYYDMYMFALRVFLFE